MKEKLLRFNLYLGISVFIFSSILLSLEVPFMKTWFFVCAWWSFILMMDSLNFRRTKSSPLFESMKVFLFMAFLSVFVWLIFELFNLRLKNWSYHDLPQGSAERWLGYFIAFASVIPAMKELSLFFRSILKGKRLALFRLRATPLLLKGCVFLGLASMFLGLTWPRLFFPMAWLCFIFLLEPVNYWLKNETFLKDFERKDWTRFWSWVLAGFSAGILWELWNFWAGSHWEYSLPYLDFGRVFNMPVLGYTGFLPFALEIFAIYTFLSWVREKLERKILLKTLIFFALIAFYLFVFYLIDTFSLIH